MNIDLHGLVETIDRDTARKTVIMLLAGPAMADTPLPSWPLSRGSLGSDEYYLAAFCKYLGLDRRGYDSLIAEMWKLSTTWKFDRIFKVLTMWLERATRLNDVALAEARVIAWM